MEYSEDKKVTFEQQQALNNIRNGVMGKACAGLTTQELERLNPSLLKAAPELYEACKALVSSPVPGTKAKQMARQALAKVESK